VHRAPLLALLFVAFGCGDPPPSDAGAETGAVMDVAFEAEPDPAELTECTEAPSAGQARAKHVTCARELVTGPLAMGMLGDIVLENAEARFLIRTGDGAASMIGAPRGGVIDAALRDGPDLLKELLPLFDLVSMQPSTIEVVDAGGDGEARVRVLFEDAPIALVSTVIPDIGRAVRLRGQLDYVLRADEPMLRIEMSVTTEAGLARSGAALGLLGLLGGMEVLEPGVGVLDDDLLGGPGNTVIGERETGAIGIVLDDDASGVTRLGTIHMIRGARSSLTRGALDHTQARLVLGETAADVAELAFDGEPVEISGPPGERVLIESSGGQPMLRTRIGADGQLRVPLTGSGHRMRAGFRGFFEGDETPAAGPIMPAPAGRLTIAATVDGREAVPVRVTVQRREEPADAELERFVSTGESSRRFPPGDYTVTVSHGLEFDVFTTDITLARGEEQRLAPDLLRALETDGWVSVDLHLHSDLSTDSVHPVQDALRLLAAEGVQAAAATDHDYVTDYARIGAEIGVDLVLASGVEVSTTTFGHINGYPLVAHPERPSAGAPAWFDMTPTDIFASLRSLGDEASGGALVQINHPRLGSASFFGARGFGRTTGTFEDPADLDFDVLEVWNGYTRGGNEDSFLDYLALLEAGHRFTMVGNSDSHIPQRPPGSPRSYVRVDDEAAWGWSDVRAGLARGEVTVAAAAIVTASLAGPVTGDSAAVQVRVLAPPWARLDQLRVYAGSTVAVERALPDSSDPVRFDAVVDVPLAGATFLVVRVDGPTPPYPIQHFAPMGVTNPIWL